MQGKIGLLLGVVLLAGCPGPRAAAEPSPLTTIGFYTFVPIHSQLPFLKACGYNLVQFCDWGYTVPPEELDAYYVRLSRDLRPYRAAGMCVWIVLLANMAQYHGEPGRQTELGLQDWLFDPADTEAMGERLEMLKRAVRGLRGAVDGFSFFAGDPGGVPLAWGGSSVEVWMDMARQVHAIVRREAPRAQFNANLWAVTQWEDLHMNCFRGRFWAREATNTRVVLREPELLGPSCGIELSMHSYYRSLALNSLLQEGMSIELSPDARDVQRLRRRGVSRVWAWPYFLLDEVDNGDLGEGFRVPQSETRYIRRFVDQARKIGLDGIIGNGGFAEDQCVELVNLYCLPRFCRDEQVTPERVLDELAGHLATQQTQKELAQVLRFSENNSTWAASLPEQYQLPPLATEIQTAAEALGMLDGVVPRDEPSFALPEPPAAYLARLKDRLRGVLGPV